mmetsp:Transcript_26051/g.66067  ORF Transcript_26051/g.66067 Transcript_26051/m.66067 type:complete len:263 (+) Transcript_26051:356-1144(+)
MPAMWEAEARARVHGQAEEPGREWRAGRDGAEAVGGCQPRCDRGACQRWGGRGDGAACESLHERTGVPRGQRRETRRQGLRQGTSIDGERGAALPVVLRHDQRLCRARRGRRVRAQAHQLLRPPADRLLLSLLRHPGRRKGHVQPSGVQPLRVDVRCLAPLELVGAHRALLVRPRAGERQRRVLLLLRLAGLQHHLGHRLDALGRRRDGPQAQGHRAEAAPRRPRRCGPAHLLRGRGVRRGGGGANRSGVRCGAGRIEQPPS